jgi:hypothetical protein
LGRPGRARPYTIDARSFVFVAEKQVSELDVCCKPWWKAIPAVAFNKDDVAPDLRVKGKV